MLWFWLQRLSNLRISSNFNCNLCREVTKACVRVGAIDFGMQKNVFERLNFDLFLFPFPYYCDVYFFHHCLAYEISLVVVKLVLLNYYSCTTVFKTVDCQRFFQSLPCVLFNLWDIIL